MIPEKYKLYNVTSYAQCYTGKDKPLEAIGLYLGKSENEFNDISDKSCVVYQFMIGLDCDHWLYASEVISEFG